MHRLKDRTYVGSPGETVTVTLTEDGGRASKTLDGVPMAGDRFQLPDVPGQGRHLEVLLVGPPGASCVVAIAEVDGGQDGDLLLCQAFDPGPVQGYDFSVASRTAVTALAATRAKKTQKKAQRRAPDASSPRRKSSGRKRGAGR